jgi:hypothetical protein
MEGWGQKRSHSPEGDHYRLEDRDDDKGKEEADGPEVPRQIDHNVVHVLGEGDDTTLCFVPLEPPEFGPIDADTLRVLVCSYMGFVSPAAMELVSHPDRTPLVGPNCFIHGGSSVHLVSVKDRTPVEPTFLFFRDMHLEIPGNLPFGQDAEGYAHEMLGLPYGTHEIIETETKQRWFMPIPEERMRLPPAPPTLKETTRPQVYGQPDTSNSASGLPPFPKMPDISRILQPVPPSAATLKRLKKSLGNPEDLDCAWDTGDRLKDEGDVVIINDDEDEEDDEDVEYGTVGDIDLYDPDAPAYDNDDEDEPAPTVATDVYKGSWDATIYLPDGSRMLQSVSCEYGDAPTDVLMEICALRGWDPACFKLLDHGLPIRPDRVFGACSYDVRPLHNI